MTHRTREGRWHLHEAGAGARRHGLRWRTGSVLLGLIAVGAPKGVFAAGVVGTGTPESCTEAALDAALAGGGLVTFNCGPAPVTITLTAAKVITAEMAATTVDGGGLITLDGNRAYGVWAFAVAQGGTLSVQNITIANGNADFGGGIGSGGTLNVNNCTFVGNWAASRGGGIFVALTGTLTVSNSTFSGNSAGGSGCGFGGAIHNYGITATVSNSTFSGNSVTCGSGGAIYNYGGTLALTSSTVSGSSANVGAIFASEGTLTVTNSIIANNTGGDCDGPAIDGGHNLIGDAANACGLTNGVNGNIVGVDPKLDPAGLKDNGGPTHTIALLPNSPAINVGDSDVCASNPVNGVDQRGYVRPGTGSAKCSIGAFEYNSPGPPVGCAGDCNADGAVTIAELITMVTIALDTANVSACMAGDANGDAAITIDEIIRAVNAALSGCGGG